jgi:phage host-nuclease inhibitor protein Gam
MSEDRLAQMQEMLTSLIQMTGDIQAKLERLEQKLDEEIELNKVRHQELLTRYKGEMDILWQKEAENEREIARFKKLIGL